MRGVAAAHSFLRKCYRSRRWAHLKCLNCLSCSCSLEAVQLIFNPLQLPSPYLLPLSFFPLLLSLLRRAAVAKMERRRLVSSCMILSCHVQLLTHWIRLSLSDYLGRIITKIDGPVIGNGDIMQWESSDADRSIISAFRIISSRMNESNRVSVPSCRLFHPPLIMLLSLSLSLALALSLSPLQMNTRWREWRRWSTWEGMKTG